MSLMCYEAEERLGLMMLRYGCTLSVLFMCLVSFKMV
jgi:hypothetical protein